MERAYSRLRVEEGGCLAQGLFPKSHGMNVMAIHLEAAGGPGCILHVSLTAVQEKLVQSNLAPDSILMELLQVPREVPMRDDGRPPQMLLPGPSESCLPTSGHFPRRLTHTDLMNRKRSNHKEWFRT